MTRLRPIDLTHAPVETQKLLAGVQDNLGMVPGMIATMAQSTVVAQAYLDFSKALSGGVISERLSEQIVLAVSQANRCDYCVAAHSAIGSSVGLTEDEIRDARNATSPDRNTEAVLQFTRRIVDERGAVSNEDIAAIRNAGFDDPEISEIIAHVGLTIFMNYFNLVAKTEIDFPPVAELDS